jgi:hypothetical protein
MRRRWTTPHLIAAPSLTNGRIYVFQRWQPFDLVGDLFDDRLPDDLPLSLYCEWDDLACYVLDEVVSERRQRKGKS